LRVGIYDTDSEKIELVRGGTMPFLEAGATELLRESLGAGRLEFSSDASIIGQTETIVLVIGTPIDEFLNPSLRVFDRVVDDITPWLKRDALVVLRSTVYPGSSEWLASALAGKGCTVDVAFCPERIAEGKAIEEIKSLPQIIGADDEKAAIRAEGLFARLGVVTVRTSTREAELTKLFNNTWRYMKFAVANQFFMIAAEAGVDYNRVLHAVGHEYPRGQDLPGPGFAAGPCLLKDAMQLSSFTGNNFLLGHAAMLINEGLPEFIVRSVLGETDLRGSTVAILGMAFKAESDDPRASLSYKLRKLLWFAGAKVICSDPYVNDPELVDAEKAVAQSDVVIVGAPHAAYRHLDCAGRRLIDIWGLIDGTIRV
jgi:UDP-N-acetyl-D-mannosaminuronic acid dehydrogenase